MPASFGYHRRIALDATRPLGERAAHARSAARQAGRTFDLARSEVIERVRDVSGVDLLKPCSDDDLARAMGALSALRDAAFADEGSLT
jgi:hypothetical protein